MTSSPPQFKPIYADLWQHDVDDWETVNPVECYRFKDGYAKLSKEGYWFPYREWQFKGWKPFDNVILVNLVKPHVLV